MEWNGDQTPTLGLLGSMVLEPDIIVSGAM